jgi:thioester reductase-like protein
VQALVVVAPEQARQAQLALGGLPPEQRERVAQLQGDVSAIDMGLSGREYGELAGRVSCIHHVAQVTHHGADRRIAERVNVGAMREVIELGRACDRLERIVVHSSAMVSGDRTGIVLEEELNAGQSFRTPVEETLALAEQMARRAMGQMPITVIRPTQIVGDSSSGEVERFDEFYLLILLMLSSPQELPWLLPARRDVPLLVVPIDYVVQAAHHLATHPAAVGGTFHLVDPNPLSVRELYELVTQSGVKARPSEPAPGGLARALVNASSVDLGSSSPRAILDLVAKQVRYGTYNADQLLQPSGIDCPRLETYIDQVVCYVQSRIGRSRSSGSLQDPAKGAE